MIGKLVRMFSIALCLYYTHGTAQVVVFNEPAPWLTSRSNSVVVKVQIDTANIEQKKIEMTLYRYRNGYKRRLARKAFKITDFSQEFSLYTYPQNIIGGEDYLQIVWSIPGTDHKGECVPVGIVNLDKIPAPKEYFAVKATKDNEFSALKEFGKKQTVVLNGKKCNFFWSQKNLYIVFETALAKKEFMVLFDGKNGKNAFLSFPDKVIQYYAKNDSLASIYHKRGLIKEKISYAETTWHTDIQKKSEGDITVITVPLYDIGVVSFEGRTIGIALFSDGGRKSLPPNAQKTLPGTWANLIMK